MIPGPGDYFIEGEGGANNLADKKEYGLPGPAYYKAIKEPSKISFLFNPAEKWV